MVRLGKSVFAAVVLVMAGCSDEPGSVRWCEEKKDQPKSQWSMDDATVFAQHCLIEGLTVGSEKWCSSLQDKPKGDWTADEAASYAKHCVM